MRFIPWLLLFSVSLCGMDKKVPPTLHVESKVLVRTIRTITSSVVDDDINGTKQVVEVELTLYKPGCTPKMVTLSIDV
jgi:hypothetical protein